GKFAEDHGFKDISAAEDEFVFQNSFRLNKEYYGSSDDKKGFVLSHGRNMMILKAVGYAEDIAQYYQLEEMEANVWIGHQRYPTRGRVWHPGGAHPFSGLDEALVHNGDFANYFGVVEYLRQKNYFPLFMTDTEVSVYLFDLYSRVFGYPLEYVIEALAPTTERDFARLPIEKQVVYRAIQRSHLHASPDGPWFFIVARNDVKTQTMQLIGITDTSMLRPQVFALQSGEKSIGVIASERQAIDALLSDIAKDDPSVCTIADKYWNARGGSYSDGGSFTFSVKDDRLVCTDKFGRTVETSTDQSAVDASPVTIRPKMTWSDKVRSDDVDHLFDAIVMGNGHPALSAWSFAE
ncbi:MAG TPA: glutamate synthase, partial [Anaerolineae bacterium]|nr:glutamate synthase [Anaerolineae bacterium]